MGLPCKVFTKHMVKSVFTTGTIPKTRRLNQRKRKNYQKRQSKKAKGPRFRIADLPSSSSDSSSSDCEYSNATDEDLQ